VDTYQQVRERVSFRDEANLGGTAGRSVLSLFWDEADFLYFEGDLNMFIFTKRWRQCHV